MIEDCPAPLGRLPLLADDAGAESQLAGFSATHIDAAGMVGDSEPMQRLRARIDREARTQQAILLLGEPGAGKEVAARAIHAARGQGRLRLVHCAVVGPDLSWQEELVATNGGTLLLRQLGALSFEAQATLARALDARRESVGDPMRRPIVVATLEEDPSALADRGLVRGEIVSALGVCTIRVPALRDRLSDLPDLIAHILGSFCRRRCACIHGVTPTALGALSAHGWPENVRELRRALDHAVIHGDGARIDVWDLPVMFHALGRAAAGGEIAQADERTPDPGGLDRLPTLAELERRLISEALRRAGGNKSEAARALGISRHKLYDALRKIG